jgi:hypothetical protein
MWLRVRRPRKNAEPEVAASVVVVGAIAGAIAGYACGDECVGAIEGGSSAAQNGGSG